jgi:osmotically-inducible protein OsmY
MTTDNQLRQDVTAELGWEPSVIAAHIGVAADGGVVTLSGHVTDYAQKHAAETAARRVRGVKAVAEEIEVRLPFESQRTDEEIAAAAIDRMGWDVTIPKDAITVRVEKGWVTLTGQVDWFFQKDNAVTELRHLFGVVGLSDQITIKPHVDVADLSDDIALALNRSWFSNAAIVTVSAQGGLVHLSGTVHLPHDKQIATEIAWSAPGVTSVQNDITVN